MRTLLTALVLSTLILSGCEWLEAESEDTRLASLTMTDGSLNPAFSASTYKYSATVDATTASITVSGTALHSKSSVTINGQSAGGGVNVGLDVGTNVIAVVVTAENGTTRTYTIEVTRPLQTYSIGGSVSGIDGELVLQNNGTDDLPVSADGDFTFANLLEDGSDYEVTVLDQPDGQECSVENGSGTLSGANVTGVAVTCVDLSFAVGGTLSGLNDTITLQNNGADDLELTEDGAFTFATELDNGAAYDVTISSQPTGQECTVSNGSGTIDGADVTNVIVACNEVLLKFVGGTVTGLNGTATLQLNGSSTLLLISNGFFNFFDQFEGGEAYNVEVMTQPENQNCTVTNGSGNIGSGHVLDVSVDCTGSGVATGSIFDWEWINPTPQGNAIWDLAANASQVVAIGRFGHVQTSPDGQNWTTRDSGTTDDLVSLAWGNGQFVATSISGSILTSDDGVTWQRQEHGVKFFSELIWTGSQFVAVGGGWLTGTTFAPLIATSTDGSTWTYTAVGSGFNSLRDVAWNGSVIAAVGSFNSVTLSDDGVNWTTIEVGDAGTFLRGIESDGNNFVTIGSGRNVYTSADGESWTLEDEQLPVTGSVFQWDGSRYVVLGQNQIATSADASTWAVHDVDSAAPLGLQGLSSIIRFNGLNIIGHQNGALSTSPDDENWTTDYQSNYLLMGDVIWNDNQFVAVGDGPTVLTSPDGTNWTTRYSAAPFSAHGMGLAWGNDLYVAVSHGSGQQILTSPDGITWTPQTLSTEFSGFQNVAWGNNQFVAVGQSGLYTSPDGTTWTDQSANLEGTEILTGVAWNGAIWVATGYDFSDALVGHAWTSSDGSNWSKQPALPGPDNLYFDSIEWNGSQFVAVGNSAIGSSVDGSTWSVTQINDPLSDVYWSGTEFLLAGYTAHVLTSTDGASWSVRRSVTGDNAGIASNESTAVLVGFSAGHIVTDTGSGAPQ